MNRSTEQLVQQLSAGLTPLPRHSLERKLAMGIAAGAVAALLLMLLSLGVRKDLAAAATGWILWGKFAYAASLAAGGYLLCAQAARPEARPGWRLAAMLAPLALAVAAALLRMAVLPAAERGDEWLGETAALCPWLVALLSLPCMFALCSILRRAAPTRLRWAGFCAGLLSGAIAMLVYSLHCPETGAAFVATWYTLGMCIPAAAGALLGPRLRRW